MRLAATAWSVRQRKDVRTPLQKSPAHYRLWQMLIIIIIWGVCNRKTRIHPYASGPAHYALFGLLLLPGMSAVSLPSDNYYLPLRMHTNLKARVFAARSTADENRCCKWK